MNWKDVGQTVAKAAPLVGSLLGGPAGGAVGELVAQALGTDADPGEVAQMVQSDPDALERIKQMEFDHKQTLERMHLEAETSRMAEINRTMRAEYQADSTFKSGWRPFVGWVFGLCVAALIASMVYAVSNDPTVVSNSEFTGLLVWLFTTMAAVLGVNIRERTRGKQIASGQTPDSGLLGALAQKLAK